MELNTQILPAETHMDVLSNMDRYMPARIREACAWAVEEINRLTLEKRSISWEVSALRVEMGRRDDSQENTLVEFLKSQGWLSPEDRDSDGQFCPGDHG